MKTAHKSPQQLSLEYEVEMGTSSQNNFWLTSEISELLASNSI